MKKTLIQKAKEVEIKKGGRFLVQTATKEQIELAIGWAKDDITLGQFVRVLWDKKSAGAVGGRALYTIACWLKAAIQKGILK